MSKRFPPESILKFQKACKALKKRGHLERTGGLCFALDRLGSDQAYEIMSTLLTGQQHFESKSLNSFSLQLQRPSRYDHFLQVHHPVHS